MKDRILKSLSKATGSPETEIHLEVPEREEFGDYSTNVALQLKTTSSISKLENPRKVADTIVAELNKDKSLKNVVEKIEVAGPGFINFWLSPKALFDMLVTINSRKSTFGKSHLLEGKKIMVEFAHPNTHKAFHIGHLRNITTGESIVRLLEAVGAKVIRANYQGDVGMHIAKAIWGLMNSKEDKPVGIKEKAIYLGKIYAKGASAYEESGDVKKEIHEINKKIYSKEDKNINDLYQETRQWSLDYFESIYKRVGTHFDRYYFESEVYESGRENVLKGLEKGIFQVSDGAIIFPGEKFNLHSRVFITKEGNTTYEGKDMGLGPLQFSEFNPDLIIHVVGPEQAAYFQVVFEALAQLFPETRGREFHLIYGWVRLKTGKMSSRKGNVVLGEDLIDEAKSKIIKEYKTQSLIAEKIAVGAVKYSFLKVSLAQEIAFDIKESISLEGNSGPYLQYTYARTQSVLRKSKTHTLKGLPLQGEYSNLELNVEELSLLRTFIHFPEVIETTAQNYSPNLLCNYLYDLAQKFNLFYQKHRIIGSSDLVLELRLGLTIATGQILSTGLNLLGITVPEKM